MGIEVFKKHLREKRAIKISALGENIDKVAKVCAAAQLARASAVDISGGKEVYETARKNTRLPLFVSSIHPFEILESVKAGVDGVQIGNYFDQYKQKRTFSVDEIYEIVLEAMGLVNNYDVYFAAAVPSFLSIGEQLELVHKFQLLGIDLIQTEGYKLSPAKSNVIAQSAQESIKNMIELSKRVSIPVMACVSNSDELKYAFNNGADAVCSDNSIYNLETQSAMQVAAMNLVRTMQYRNSINREIPKSSVEFSL